jgi:hypothetical protein
MDSRELTPIEGYPTLSDGSGVHMSDAMCQLISRNIDGGMPMDTAMAEAFLEMPSEIVGLLVSLSDPEGIAWSRINMPMMLAFADHGAYLASSAMGIPEDAREPIPLPPCAGGMVYKDSFTVSLSGNSPVPWLPSQPVCGSRLTKPCALPCARNPGRSVLCRIQWSPSLIRRILTL